MDVIGGVLSVLLLICLAGVVYPFKPFKSRKWALLSSVLLFIVMLVQFSILAASPEFQAELESQAEIAVNSATSALETGNYDEAESILHDLSDLAAEKKSEEIISLRKAITKERFMQRVAVITNNESETATSQIEAIAKMWRELNNNSDARRAISPTLEPIVAKIVKAVPAQNWDQNRQGYDLLSTINKAGDNINPQYHAKAKSYEDKIDAKKRRQKEAVIAKAVQGLTKKYDKVDKQTWYSHPNSPKYINSRTTAYVYLGYDPKIGSWLRLKTTYTAEDWLFVKSVQAFIDGETFMLTSGRFETDHDTKIWEWKDELATSEQLAVLNKMANGQDVVLRFNGQQYRRDKTISRGDKLAIGEILAAHAALHAAK